MTSPTRRILRARRRLLGAGAALTCAAIVGIAGLASPARAEGQTDGFPSKPIRIIVPYTAGGASDSLARVIGNELQQTWGEAVIVENRPGASGAIGTEYVVRSDPDGYTLLISDLGTLTIGPSIYDNLRFDVQRDLAPITILTSSPYLVTVNPEVPIHTLQELLDYSRANPGRLNYASSGMGTNPHMAGLLFATRMGLEWTYIPSKGGSQAIMDVISGQADLMFNSAFSTSSFVKGGKLRLIAVSTPNRLADYPDVPSISEVLPEYNTGAFQAMFARAGTPPEVIERIQQEVVRILGKPDVVEKLRGLGAEPYGSTAQEMAQFVREDRERWARLVNDLDFKIER